jgi:hypothetical protein
MLLMLVVNEFVSDEYACLFKATARTTGRKDIVHTPEKRL